jgi:hypothetical protein
VVLREEVEVDPAARLAAERVEAGARLTLVAKVKQVALLERELASTPGWIDRSAPMPSAIRPVAKAEAPSIRAGPVVPADLAEAREREALPAGRVERRAGRGRAAVTREPIRPGQQRMQVTDAS